MLIATEPAILTAELPARPAVPALSIAESARLRVLFVQSQTEIGGAEVGLLTMLAHLDRTCLDPYFASLEFGHGNFPASVESLGIPVFRFPSARFRNFRHTARTLAALRRLILGKKIDVVLSSGGHPHLFARPAALMSGKPCVWWVHGYEPTDPLRGQPITLALQALSAEALFSNSAHTAKVLSEDFASRTPIRIVRNGVDLHRHSPDPAAGRAARMALSLPASEPVIGMFGRLQPWKGQHIFLRAAARLISEGLPGRFLLIGGSVFGLDRDYDESLRRFVRDNALDHRITFLGQRSDINALMNACDIVVHASVEPEPWGLVVAEAMAAGRAVIASAAGGPLEMIDPGRTGLLFAPGDDAALADALRTFLLHDELRHNCGAAALAHARAEFDATRAAAVLCRELRRVHESFQHST